MQTADGQQLEEEQRQLQLDLMEQQVLLCVSCFHCTLQLFWSLDSMLLQAFGSRILRVFDMLLFKKKN